MKKVQDLREIFHPNEMPTMWGSTAKPELPHKFRVIYGIGFVVILIAGMLQNNLTIANISEIQGKLGLTQEEGAYITALYYMGSAWMSLVLFKIRQHIGVNKFIAIIVSMLILSHMVAAVQNSFLLFGISRLLNGLCGGGMTVLCIYYALQMLPTSKKVLLMPISIGLMQIGAPLSRYLAPIIMINEDAASALWLEFGTILAVLVVTMLIELPPSEAKKAIQKYDILSFVLYGVGTAITCLVLSVGVVIWWDTPWIGYMICLAIIVFLGLFLIEFNRKNPLINFSFISTFNLLKIAFAGGFIRMSLSEQSIGMAGFFKNIVGFSDYQLIEYYGVLSLGAILGGVLSLILMNYKRSYFIFIISFFMVAVGSFLVGNISPLSTPKSIYLSQFLIAAAAILFIAPLLISGFIKALARGNSYILTFMAVFSFSQSFFGLLGTAGISYFIKFKIAQYSQDLINRIPSTNSLYKVDPSLNLDITKIAGALAYSDLFSAVGVFASIILVFLIIELGYYIRHKKVESGRELMLLRKKAVHLENKAKKLLKED